ncbi:unnamed protein product [[Candida] boidinii]|uniref:Unnamed protein product n=1 Tax=Candida boidinii TaxID=5477 RepID=A0A9W6SWJ2_CANBO|nr:unnamed protein product [[Candida] boidinii]GMF58103.1 unnamed protein product [[Candida] boidinii]GMG07280.1 unnamed protein product [[Candida] boidinii]
MSKLEEVSRQFSKLQNDLTELVSSRQQLETQYQENKIVKDEFNKLDDDSKIYKLIGPVLLPQDNTEANLNVDKRIEFIEKEMYVRIEKQIKTTQVEMEKSRSELINIRTQMQAPQQTA